MTVTKIEAVANTKTRYKVFLDEQFAFVLYKGELSRYHVTVGEEIVSEIYQEIQEAVLKRAKLRALHLLNDMGRTEMQLRQKLKQNEYTSDVIEETMKYVKSFGYVNDKEYARSFILNRKNKKSRKELHMLLSQKGLSEEILEEIFEEVYDDNSSKEAIKALIMKKKFNPEIATYKDKQKMFAYLTRKGFCFEDIRQVIQIDGQNA